MRLAPLAALIVLAACNPFGQEAEPTAPVGTAEFVQQQQAACEARGGRFGDGPGKVTKVCYIEPPDGNQPCTTSADCEGQCLARSRTCAPVIPLFGCHEVIQSNGLVSTLCLD